MKARNPVCQSISLNQSKKGLLYRNNYEGVVSYILSDWLSQFTASVESSMDVISLWHCSNVTKALVAFIAALNLPVLLGPTFLLFLLTAAQRFPVGLSQGLVGWSIKLINIIDNKLFVLMSVCWASSNSCWKRELPSQ